MGPNARPSLPLPRPKDSKFDASKVVLGAVLGHFAIVAKSSQIYQN